MLRNPTKAAAPHPDEYTSFNIPFVRQSSGSSETNMVRTVLHAAMLGFFGGLCTNSNMVIGVCISTWIKTTVDESQIKDDVLLTGFAGIVAGSFSMACYEIVSNMHGRVTENETSRNHDVNQGRAFQTDDLEALLLAHGFISDTIQKMLYDVRTMSRENSDWFHARFGLFINEEYNKPFSILALRALVTWVSFAVGAAVPVLPWLLSSPLTAVHTIIPITVAVILSASIFVSAAFTVLLNGSYNNIPFLRLCIHQLAMVTISMSLATALNILVLGQL